MSLLDTLTGRRRRRTIVTVADLAEDAHVNPVAAAMTITEVRARGRIAGAAVETRARARLVPVVLSLPGARRAERAKQAHADEILDFLGLGAYADRFVNELSTGMRRILEFACLLATDAKVLCLDEPTAGVAQRFLAGALDAMVSSRVGGVVVVDGRGAYVGTVDMGVIMAAAETMRAAAHERALAGDDRTTRAARPGVDVEQDRV